MKTQHTSQLNTDKKLLIRLKKRRYQLSNGQQQVETNKHGEIKLNRYSKMRSLRNVLSNPSYMLIMINLMPLKVPCLQANRTLLIRLVGNRNMSSFMLYLNSKRPSKIKLKLTMSLRELNKNVLSSLKCRPIINNPGSKPQGKQLKLCKTSMFRSRQIDLTKLERRKKE